LEVYGDDVFSWHRSLPLQDDIRFEQVGETFFHYGENLECLVHSLDERVGIRYSYRPSNLEDVFLKLTGGSYEMIDALCLWVAVWRRNALVWRKPIRTSWDDSPNQYFIYLRWDMVSGPLSGKLKDYRAWRPLQHVVEIIRTLLSGRISQDILKHLLILAAYAGLAISCAIWRSRRRLPLLIKTVGS
jgi:hypothetical protein